MKIITLIFALGFLSTITYGQWQPTGTTSGTIYYTGGNVGIKTPTPKSILDIYTADGNSATGIVISQGSNSNNSHSGRLFFTNTGNVSNSFAILKSGDKLSFRGDATPGSSSGTELFSLHKNGDLFTTGDLTLASKKKLIQERSNTYSEFITASHGQGAGWMINATYDQSADPQSDAKFKVDKGNYNTGAGYLDFDGNARRWSFFVSSGESVKGNAVPFEQLFTFEWNEEAWMSPRGNSSDFYINKDGKVGMGTTTPTALLSVAGSMDAREIKVETTAGADYVLEEGYQLPTLEETAAFIKENHHLPEIPSEKEMIAEGINLGEMNMLLLKKIEELTLHLIEKDEEIKGLKKEMSKIEMLESRLKKLELNDY